MGVPPDEGSIASLVQGRVGERTTPDPLFPHAAIPYWRLFRRDRNELAHGHAKFPLVPIGRMFAEMEIFLREVAP